MRWYGDDDDEGMMLVMTVVVSVGEWWWWRNASGGAWVGGSGRSVNGESFWSSPEKPVGKVFRRWWWWWWSPAAGHGRERGEGVVNSKNKTKAASLVMCMCFKGSFWTLIEHKQDNPVLENPVDFEEEILDAKVQQNEAIPISDEEIALDAASSEGTMSGSGLGGDVDCDMTTNYGDDY
ncbi:hypothetical protein Tco_0628648 [Tanacetum coccineum]|uniref:Uncharacterized protein n=1 Tax=Tanacetum coccineum TaxID=301880 RepID=A0ABQ4WQX0_9ASTR